MTVAHMSRSSVALYLPLKAPAPRDRGGRERGAGRAMKTGERRAVAGIMAECRNGPAKEKGPKKRGKRKKRSSL